MKIAVIGAGNVGSTLGKAWVQKGHEVVFGVRDSNAENVQALLREMGGSSRAVSNAEAAISAEVVVLSTPWETTRQAIEACGDLSGKIVIDCTNPLAPGLSGLSLGFHHSGGEQVAEWAKGASVYKAFNQTGFNIMADPVLEGHKAVMFVCGDDADRKPTVLQLVEDVGFEAVDAGPLDTARLLEPLAMLWIKLAVAYGQGRDFAFALLRRQG